jgi:hypothetical protein
MQKYVPKAAATDQTAQPRSLWPEALAGDIESVCLLIQSLASTPAVIG